MQDYFKKLFRENAWYLACFVLFLIAGAVLLLNTEKGDAVFYFSDRRSPFWDTFFVNATKLGEGLFFAVFAIVFLFIRFRTAIMFPILGLTVLLVTNLTKRFFGRPRPWLYYRELGMDDLLTPVVGAPLLGGANSFPSGHTMAGFALYTFLALVVARKRGVAVLLFAIALLVGISRIYLVVHFLEDVYLGAILGVALAILYHYLHQKYPNRRWADESLRTIRKRPPTP
jgi:membrane-associated phospholipid phosphatase